MRNLLRLRASLVAVSIAASLSLAIAAAAQSPTRQVLVIHGGPEAFPGNDTFDASLRQVLLSNPRIPLDVQSEYLENEEFGEVADTSLREYLRIKYANRHVDLVIANTAPALEFVLRHRNELFPDVPVVFISAAIPAGLAEGKLRGVAGMLRNSSQVETVELALKMHPATTRVHVVAYAPRVEGFESRTRAALAVLSDRVKMTYASEPALPELIAALKTLPADSLIFWLRYSPVSKGRVIFSDEFLPEIAAAAPVPIYASQDMDLGKGVVGGMTRSNVRDTQRLGAMALRVLEGTSPESIPVEEADVRPVFDWRALQRWDIDEARLPAGSDIRYRIPTVWQLYGNYILATLVVVIAQLLLIAGLLRQRARLRSADNTIRARETSLRTSYDRIRQLAGRLINAQEVARANIARDLHDDVSQKLAYVSVAVNGLRNATGNLQDPQTQEAFEELERETRNTFDGIRRLSHDLHPATLRLLGLAPALRSHCSEVAKRQGVEVTFSSSNDVGTVHPDVAVCFFRIAQESLRNGIVHGGSKRLSVTLERAGDHLELAVADDGRGFDVGAIHSSDGGIGLVTMEERANLVGGHVSISSAVGQGTTVRVKGPVEPAAPASALHGAGPSTVGASAVPSHLAKQ